MSDICGFCFFNGTFELSPNLSSQIVFLKDNYIYNWKLIYIPILEIIPVVLLK